jgi:hypothetical protein
MCGRACTAPSTCNSGVCNSLCGAGTTSCGGRCVALTTFQTDQQPTAAAAATCARAGTACTAGVCRPTNDARASAITLVPSAAREVTATGTTVNATNDGPSVPCACTSGTGNVWYRFTVPSPGGAWCTSTRPVRPLIPRCISPTASGVALPAQASAGSPNLGLCNDDARCATGGGFTSGDAVAYGGRAGGGHLLRGRRRLRRGHVYAADAVPAPQRREQLHQRDAHRHGQRERHHRGHGGVVGHLRRHRRLGGRAVVCELRRGSAAVQRVSQRPGCVVGAAARHELVAHLRPGDVRAQRPDRRPGELQRRRRHDGRHRLPRHRRAHPAPVESRIDSRQYGSRLNNLQTPRGLNAVFIDSLSGGAGLIYNLRYQVQ